MSIIDSRELARRVVEQVGVEAVLAKGSADAKPTEGALGWLDEMLARIRGLRASVSLDPVSEREEAILSVIESLSAAAGEDLNVITLRVEGSTAPWAQMVASSAVQNYLTMHAEVNRTSGTLEFFEDESQRMKGQLAAARGKLQAAKDSAQIMSVDGQRTGLQEQANWIELTLLQLQVSRENARSSISALEVESLDHQIELLKTQRSDLLKKLVPLHATETELADHETTVAMCEANYRDYASKLEQVRISEALAANAITNVNVAQPAELQEIPVTPNKMIVAVAGLFLATAGALGLVFGAEFLNQTFGRHGQLESELRLPVLITIPHKCPRALA